LPFLRGSQSGKSLSWLIHRKNGTAEGVWNWRQNVIFFLRTDDGLEKRGLLFSGMLIISMLHYSPSILEKRKGLKGSFKVDEPPNVWKRGESGRGCVVKESLQDGDRNKRVFVGLAKFYDGGPLFEK